MYLKKIQYIYIYIYIYLYIYIELINLVNQHIFDKPTVK